MEQLGIEPALLLAQVINFIIISFILTKLLYKPIVAMLEKRKKEIQEGLILTEKLRIEEEKVKERSDKYLEQARKDARILIEKAKKDATEKNVQMVATAHEEAAKILERAKSEAKEMQRQMQKDVQKEAVELAVEMTKRLTRDVLTEKVQHELLKKHLKQLEAVRV